MWAICYHRNQPRYVGGGGKTHCRNRKILLFFKVKLFSSQSVIFLMARGVCVCVCLYPFYLNKFQSAFPTTLPFEPRDSAFQSSVSLKEGQQKRIPEHPCEPGVALPSGMHRAVRHPTLMAQSHWVKPSMMLSYLCPHCHTQRPLRT